MCKSDADLPPETVYIIFIILLLLRFFFFILYLTLVPLLPKNCSLGAREVNKHRKFVPSAEK